MNYGAIGMVMGHELIHGFGISRKHYDTDGIVKNWWDPSTTERFMKRAKCFSKQYDNYKVENNHVRKPFIDYSLLIY